MLGARREPRLRGTKIPSQAGDRGMGEVCEGDGWAMPADFTGALRDFTLAPTSPPVPSQVPRSLRVVSWENPAAGDRRAGAAAEGGGASATANARPRRDAAADREHRGRGPEFRRLHLPIHPGL